MYEYDWIIDNQDSFRQQVFARTKTESDQYVTRCLTKEDMYDANTTHTIIILNPVFIDFVPNHKQLQENSYLQWFNLYININR